MSGRRVSSDAGRNPGRRRCRRWARHARRLLPRSAGADTLEAAERRHITAVLNECDWVVGGTAGAAARLGMKRSTQQFRMRKLGIVRPRRGA